ncbi:cation diffusion facilitator family transporter [Aspergillus tanneri]|uniref:Uncharacterized protein n=1 Tax=Aspergillus tanneri TaxID=1220188 RepID=A0A5M9MI32_9EURO|nr:uncharacterized protein ATNIH1004_009241 [Aspergillus tanneri]KAA8645030.1 hypothetical protein ATNIH1004_009241 [Aspergillus tanneri]
MNFKLSRIQRLSAVIGISTSFFIAEIAVGFKTGSLALVADAFHYLSDIIGFLVALVAAIVEQRPSPPQALTFGWQRSQLVGAFFNGVLLFGLGISIFLQSLERFITLEHVQQPKLVMIVGCVGFGLNIFSVLFLHGNSESDALVNEKHILHKHYLNSSTTKPKKRNFDLALMGVFIHIMGDCANNLGVIIAGLVIWLADYRARYYADPAVSMAIAVMIFISSLPLIKRSGLILLQSAPEGVEHEDVKHDLEQIPGIRAIHELHIWRLNQKKSLASAHLVLEDDAEFDFNMLAITVNECFHAYGIHSVTLQPEVSPREKTCAQASAEDRMVKVSSHGLEDGAKGQNHKAVLNTKSGFGMVG